MQRAATIFLLIFLVSITVSIIVYIIPFSAYAQGTDCWDGIVLFVLQINDALECLDDKIDASGSGPGSGATELDELDDVVLSNEQDGEVLKYNGTHFVNAEDEVGEVSEIESGFPLPSIKKIGWVYPANGAGDMGGLMFAAAQDGTETIGVDSDGGKISAVSGTTAGNDAGVRSVNGMFRAEWDIYLEAKVKTNSTSGHRLFIGFMSAGSINNSENMCNARDCAGFFVRNSDSNYQIVVNDNDGTQDLTSTGIAEDTNVHTFKIRSDSANNRFGFTIDNGTEVFITSDIPPASNDLFVSVMSETTDASPELFEYYYVYVTSNK